MTQTYCKPYRFNIDIQTCKTRLKIINKEHERYGLSSLNKDQKKCWKCQGNSEVSPEPKELVCKDCRKKKSEVARFHPQLDLCNRCYQVAYNAPVATSEVKV